MTSNERDRWGVVAAAGLAILVTMTDVGLVNISVPGFADHFHRPTGEALWLIAAYLVPLSAATVPIGRWLPTVGLRASLLLGVAGLGVADLLAGFAPSFGWLLAARALAGLAGALLVMTAPRLPAVAVSPQRRRIAMSVTGVTGPLGLTAGAVWGGLVHDPDDWQKLFWVIPPAALVVIVVILATVDATEGLRAPRAAEVADFLLFAGALGGLTLALSLGPATDRAWWWALLPGLALLLVWARRAANRPIVALAFAPGTRGPLLAMLLVLGAANTAQFLSPFFLLDIAGVSWRAAAFAVPALALSMVVLSVVSTVLSTRFKPRTLAVAASLIVAAGMLSLGTLSAGSGAADVAWRLAIVGGGVGLFNGPHQMLVLTSLPDPRATPAGIDISWIMRNLSFAFAPVAGAAAWALRDGDLLAGLQTVLFAGAAAALIGAAAQVRLRSAAPEAEAVRSAPAGAGRPA